MARIRGHICLLGAAVAFAATVASATPLPAVFGGGNLPASDDDGKSELAIAKTAGKLGAAQTKCLAKGVSNLAGSKPDGYAACNSLAQTKLTAAIAKITAKNSAACVATSASGTVTTLGLLVGFLGPGVWCDGGPAGGGLPSGINVPSGANAAKIAKVEGSAATALVKLGLGGATCYQKGFGTLLKDESADPTSAVNACLAKAQAGFDATAAKLNADANAPGCLDLATLATTLVAGLPVLNVSVFNCN